MEAQGSCAHVSVHLCFSVHYGHVEADGVSYNRRLSRLFVAPGKKPDPHIEIGRQGRSSAPTKSIISLSAFVQQGAKTNNYVSLMS